MNIGLIAMSRTGHRAVMEWLRRTGAGVENVEAKTFHLSLSYCTTNGYMPVMLLRDFPNWLASMVSFFGTNSADWYQPHIDKWITHAKAAGSVPTVVYHDWVLAGHGDEIDVHALKTAPQVTAFDGGSVLARAPHLLTHGKTYPVFRELLKTRNDAVLLSLGLFGDVADEYRRSDAA